ncbi:MAG: hypothetical protein AB1767_06365 [Bacillota bacterium]
MHLDETHHVGSAENADQCAVVHDQRAAFVLRGHLHHDHGGIETTRLCLYGVMILAAAYLHSGSWPCQVVFPALASLINKSRRMEAYQ